MATSKIVKNRCYNGNNKKLDSFFFEKRLKNH